MNEFSVTVLGYSSAIPTSTRFPSAQIVSHNYQPFLVDCGEGTQIQLRKNQVRFLKIHHIFISHMHGDHFFGLVGLISSFNLLGRKEDLNVYGPYEIKEVIEMQLNITLTKLNFSINYHVLNFEDKQLIYEDKRLEIFSFPLIHSIPTCGFLFKEKVHPRKIIKHKLLEYDIPNDDFENLKIGIDIKDKLGNIIPNEELTIPGRAIKSYAYCSDTAYSDRLKDFFQDVNLLYHETSFMEDMRAIAEAKLHSTTIDAARAAMDTNAKKLMIGHFSARYKELDGLIAETKKAFKNTIAADESLKVKI